MRSTLARFVLAFGIFAIGLVLGVRLISYSDADDAPGGVVIGALLIFGALALGARIALRKT